MAMTMTTFSSPPTSPPSHRKRQSLRISSSQSAHDSTTSSIFATGTTSSHQSRRSSQTSVQQPPYSPVTQRSFSIRSKRPSSSRLSIGSNISAGVTSNAGFGNLADELEEALEDEDVLGSPSFLVETEEVQADSEVQSPVHSQNKYSVAYSQSSPATTRFLEPPEKPPSPSKQWTSMGTPHRKSESFYEGSDHCPSSEDEAFDQIAPTLQRRIKNVGDIARMSTNTEGLPELENAIPRTAAALKDGLESQPTLETGVTRLITAYTSMSTHRTHQLREMANMSHPLMSNTSFSQSLSNLPAETIDLLIDELDCLAATLPFLPNSDESLGNDTPLTALQKLATQTYDLFISLQSLEDTLTEHRQHLLTATRKLKNVRDLVDDLTCEEELVETSMLLIQAGDWDRRCRERQAKKMVDEIMEGFKKTWEPNISDGGCKPGTESGTPFAVG